MKDYSIEKLVETFGKHHEQSLEDYEKRKKDYPDSKEDPYDFSLPLALQKICKEIVELKKKDLIGNHYKSYDY